MPRRSIDIRLVALAAVLAALAAGAPAAAAVAGDPPTARAEGRVVAVTAYPPPARSPAATVAGAQVARQPSAAAEAPRAHAAGAASVAIRDFSFGPSAVTVHAGDTVTWTNAGPTDHTATGAGFDTGTLGKGQSGSHTFASAGTFAYRCTLHPFMRGTVTVVAAVAGGGGASSPAGTGAPAPAPAGAAVPAPAPATARPTLPKTGADALGRALGGVALLLAGLLLRARTRAR
jgi:plastocyanin